ncbi:MAG: hypothetical protein KAJ14_10180 [Candidatus Omnitrophica bacterium]|nr:hypothetical protein [Candidatus Omnitrophota bacterium]
MKFINWVPIIVILITLGGSMLTWTANEKSKRLEEEFKRREERYSKLLDVMKGFYVGSTSTTQQQEFLKETDLSWLYCPDEIIRKAYAFLETLKPENKNRYSPEELNKTQKTTLQELILAMRKDLIKREKLKETELKAEEFQILNPTNLTR